MGQIVSCPVLCKSISHFAKKVPGRSMWQFVTNGVRFDIWVQIVKQIRWKTCYKMNIKQKYERTKK